MNIRSAAIILIFEGKALLQLRDDSPNISYPNTWGFAGGGHMDEGETFLLAAQRELKEETGYVSKNPIEFMTTEYTLPNGTHVKAVRFYEHYDGMQKLNCYEGQKITFASPEEIDTMNMYPGVGEAAKLAIEKATKNTIKNINF